MEIRTNVGLKVHDRLAEAAKRRKGMSLGQLNRLLGPSRNIFGVIWELRRWGAEVTAIRNGRNIVGWMLKTKLPGLERRLKEPTVQTYMDYDKKLFLAAKKKAKRAKVRGDGFGFVQKANEAALASVASEQVA